ncbi:hydroxymethylbilane synthase [Parasphingopyxis algicola]|uniref:hydroxymethylbilane synthase n=1 Tax=Parasphingopyxis algicola TaxID=2026624 RepID=UPI00159FEA59|nr:hydroxymethylbilane synthase [Parasphingopyxis algicola]QLC25680.1 hydroxymethylbilane synthase [Parasphingopyxis algicola]
MDTPLRLGTRGSPLAMAQAHMVKAALIDAHRMTDGDIAIVPVKTTGDKVQDRPLAEIGGKALWTKELDRALGEREIDFAVHSMKDVETIRPAEIVLAANLPRADVRDRLIGADSLDDLSRGARVGTSSPRRAAQLLNLRPDLSIETLRGNVATRLAAVESGSVDATLLAAAGLDRLGHRDIGTGIPVGTVLPAAQQGAIGIETLAANKTVRSLIGGINDPDTFQCIDAERALLYALGADCHSPVAALAHIRDGVMTVHAELLLHDGSDKIALSAEGPPSNRLEIGGNLGRSLLDGASPAVRTLFAG